MPYPPHFPRKHPHLPASEAIALGWEATRPHRWKRGQSGNPTGFSRSRRMQLIACEMAALERSPEALTVLTELMHQSADDRVRTRAAELILERGMGRPREAAPLEEVEQALNGVKVEISFVEAATAKGAAAKLEPPRLESAGAVPLPAGPVMDLEPTSEAVAALETQIAEIEAQIEAEKARLLAAEDAEETADGAW